MAGKRLGFGGNCSVLFLDAARIIKEMRTATNGMYPTFAVWENVPGAFSSNGGEDFRTVLEELARIAQPDVSIPRPTGRGGRWNKTGAIAGNGWSLAWRQLDAQHWGVPQRRKRIALVMDFGGQRAAEILFERTSLSGNPDESIQAWEATPGRSQASPSGCDRTGERIIYDARGNGDGRTCPTITGDHENRITDYTAIAIERQTFNEQSFSHYKESDKCSTLKAKAGNIGNGSECLIAEKTIRWIVRRLTPVECERLQGFPEIMEANIMEMTKDEYIAFNLATGQIIADCENGKVYTTKGPGGNILKEPKELSGTIIKGYRVVSIRNGNVKKQCRVHRIIWIAKNGIIQDGLVVDHINNDKLDNRINNLQLLTAKENSTKASEDGLYRSGNENPATILPEEKRIEVVLLYQTGEFTMNQLAEKYGISKSRVHQVVKAYGYTDIGDWTDSKGKKHKYADSPRYKALGNSIALPQWFWLVQKMRPYLKEKPALGSLFDGLGGFPLVWQTAYGDGTARWASEIEEFPMAVTKRRFGEE